MGARPEWVLYYFDGTVHARATTTPSLTQNILTIVVPSGKKLGVIKQHTFAFNPTYDLLTTSGRVLGVLKINFLGTKATIKDPSGTELITMTRPYFRWTDTWTVKVLDRDLLEKLHFDTRLVLTSMAFQTDREWRKGEAVANAIIFGLQVAVKVNEKLKEEENKKKQSSLLQLPNKETPLIAEADAEADVESYASIPTQAIDENKVLGEIQEVNSKLAQYAREFKGPVTDKDFEAAQQFVDTQLESLEEHHDARAIEEENFSQPALEPERIIHGVTTIMQLMEGSHELTNSQKAALVIIMQKLLSDMS